MPIVVAALTILNLECAMESKLEIPPTPTQWATDTAEFLSVEALEEINAELEAYEKSSGHQVIVWIGHSTHGEAVESWCMRVANAWGIGRKACDDGVILFVFADDDIRRIQVGAGLEGKLKDRECIHILKSHVVPLIHAGHHDEAIRRGVKAIVRELSKEH